MIYVVSPVLNDGVNSKDIYLLYSAIMFIEVKYGGEYTLLDRERERERERESCIVFKRKCKTLVRFQQIWGSVIRDSC